MRTQTTDLYRSVTQTDAFKPSTIHRRRYRYVWRKMCSLLSIATIKRVTLPRVKLTRAKLGERAKLTSRRSGTRPTGPRQTRTRQKGRAKLDCNQDNFYGRSATKRIVIKEPSLYKFRIKYSPDVIIYNIIYVQKIIYAFLSVHLYLKIL